jgi:hypothetical protein
LNIIISADNLVSVDGNRREEVMKVFAVGSNNQIISGQVGGEDLPIKTW